MFYLLENNAQFEYDIRGLIMSFWPGEQIRATVAEEGEAAIEDRKTISDSKQEEHFSTEGASNLKTDCAVSDAVDVASQLLCMKVLYQEDITVTVTLTVGELTFSETVVHSDRERRARKTDTKCLVYRLCKEATGRELVWGTLTGIRPTKVAIGCIEAGMTYEEALRELVDVYYVSQKKAQLSLEIAKRELELLEKIDYKNGYSLYIGIPFCPTRCLYCSFTSYPLSKKGDQVDRYLDALIHELEETAKLFSGKVLDTIYMGGGTPTTLSPDQMHRLLSAVEKFFDLSHLKEFTVEAGRPDSVTPEKLEVLRKHPITRISINPQTMKEETLQIIGRRHTVDQVKEAFAMARKKGFDNINMDLILGLPDETAEDVEHTMQELTKLDPDNITVHSLAIKRAARLNTEKERYSGYSYVNSDETMEITDRYARALDMTPYYLYRQKNMTGNLENVGFAKPHKAGIYNILIMEEVQTIVACGAGTVTKRVYHTGDGRIERCDDVKDVDLYIERIEEMIERKKTLFAD